MNKQEITELAIKLLGLCCFVYAFSLISSSINVLLINGLVPTPFAHWSSWIASSTALVGTPIAAGIALFVFAKRLAASWFRFHNPTATTLIKINAEELHSILLSVLGFALIVSAVIPMFSAVLFWLEPRPEGVDVSWSAPLITLVGLVFELLVGLWLALGSRGIVGLVYRFRYAGR